MTVRFRSLLIITPKTFTWLTRSSFLLFMVKGWHWLLAFENCTRSTLRWWSVLFSTLPFHRRFRSFQSVFEPVQSIIKEWNKGAKIVACNCISAARVAPLNGLLIYGASYIIVKLYLNALKAETTVLLLKAETHRPWNHNATRFL